MPLKIIIIGAGTYGSYLANSIAERSPQSDIHLFDVGGSKTRSEKEIGFTSKVKGGLYRASSDGRFFGLGGTSAKWGGQLLFFSEKDFLNDKAMQDIVHTNITYRDKVLGRFFKNAPALVEKKFDAEFFVKQGIWLKFNQRNIFNHFKLNKNKNITIHTNARIIKLNIDNDRVTSIEVQAPGSTEIVTHTADVFYLTSGALESLRLLDASAVLDMRKSSQGFADHISLRCFKINKPSGKIADLDLQFKFLNGSMITSRLIGEANNVSYYVHAIFNEDFQIFQFLKQMIFKGKFSLEKLALSWKQFLHIFPFVSNYLFKKKLYIYGGWYINIDVELPNHSNNISRSDQLDVYRQNGINIQYQVTDDALHTLLQIKQNVKKILTDAKVDFTELNNADAATLKVEDTYHPYAMFNYSDNTSVFDVYNPVSNLFMFNTGLLNRAGGINPTASLFCLIEHHMDHKFDDLVKMRPIVYADNIKISADVTQGAKTAY